MVFIVIIAGIIISVYVLKEQFKRKNPSVRGKKVAGLFLAPILQIACTGGLLYDALNLDLINSHSWLGSIFGFINEMNNSAVESAYYESAANYTTATEICFAITLCSAGYLLYKLFDDDECNKLLMHTLIGIGSVACCVTVFYCGQFFVNAMAYLGENVSEEYPLYVVFGVLYFLLCAWYYFHVSLKYVLSSSTSTAADAPRPSAKKKSETTMTDKTQDLLNLKALLDSGILTQEEFDAQKKEILNS